MTAAKKGRQSIVEVTVVDIKPLLNETYELMKKDGQLEEGVTSVDVHGINFGYVKTSDGIYFLNDDCLSVIMNEEAVAPGEEKPVPIYFQREKSHSMVPNAEIYIGQDDILKLPVLGRKSLGEFVRTFGGRIETNFRNWNRFLTPIHVPQGEN